MNIKITSDSQVLQEGLNVLLTHLEPSKVLRFWAACQVGKGDYIELKKELFSQENVDSLYEKVKSFQESADKE